jgi:hypothetical protein
MKSRFLITLLLLVVVVYAASAQEIQSVFKGAKTTGGYGALANKFTTIQGQYANLCEVYGGVFLNRKWMLGLSFAGSTNNIEVPFEYSTNPLQPMTYQYSQGGLMLERVIGSNKTVHLVLNLFSGAGFTMQYNRDYMYDYDYDYNSPVHDENWFYVVEPGAQLEINLFRWMRLSPGISYRKTYGSSGQSLSDNDLSNWSYNATLKFGGFGKRNGQTD